MNLIGSTARVFSSNKCAYQVNKHCPGYSKTHKTGFRDHFEVLKIMRNQASEQMQEKRFPPTQSLLLSSM